MSRVCIAWLYGIVVALHICHPGSGVMAAKDTWLSQHHKREIQPGVLQNVVELDPPVLTVDAQGELQLRDGSSKAPYDLGGDGPLCQQVLVAYAFANSYSAPYIGNYTPPPCNFNRVTWNLTVTASGTQYDRLGSIYIGDIEVMRTSTAEPGGGSIVWTYLKVS